MELPETLMVGGPDSEERVFQFKDEECKEAYAKTRAIHRKLDIDWLCKTDFLQISRHPIALDAYKEV